MKRQSHARIVAVAVLVALRVGSELLAQNKPAQDQWELAAKNHELFLETMVKQFRWTEPAEPMKVVGPIYFVGTKDLSVWLITTSQGHILLSTGMPSSGPTIEASIRKLGFKPEDVKFILTCHAHIDHVGGHAYLKKLSRAQVAITVYQSGDARVQTSPPPMLEGERTPGVAPESFITTQRAAN